MIPATKGNTYLYWLGLSFMALNKVRHMVGGYKTPRTFSTESVSRSVDYSVQVCDEWEEKLAEYTDVDRPFEGKDILEVGPGPDVGNGLVLLSRGAKSYTAVDKNDLIQQTSSEFYDCLLNRLEPNVDYEKARRSYDLFMAGEKASPLRYVHDPVFKLEKVEKVKFDLVVSRAAIEHFDDVPFFFKVIKTKMRSGGIMVSLIDAKTHTRYIRDIDPLNILRYSDKIYRLLSFSGSPNRWRKTDYLRLLKDLGYRKILSNDYEIVSDNYINAVKHSLAARFQGNEDLESMVFWFLASC